MNFIPLIAALGAVIFVSFFDGLLTGLLFGLVTGLVTMQWDARQKFRRLEAQIGELSDSLAIITAGRATAAHPASTTSAAEQASSTGNAASVWPAPPHKHLDAAPTNTSVEPEPVAASGPSPATPAVTGSAPTLEHPHDPVELFFARIRQVVWHYFTDGNIFVRVGLLVLFFGVAFLLKYAAENSSLPLEYRFLGAAAGGMAVLYLGWRLRSNKPVYALLLQGGGIGILYITIFASYRIANLIPSTLSFALLVSFALFTALLAVLQNSRALAIFAVLGGFLAPLLASSGSGNYIGLFSYYVVLNIAVFLIAWFKPWRMLNLIGFGFSFGSYALWFSGSYEIEMLVPALSFLLIFFGIYSITGVLYALKQSHELKGLVDGTLVFGTPLVASSLLMGLVRHLEYGVAIAAASFGLYYILLVRFLWQRSGEQLRVLCEALLAIAVVFATIAVPYSLDGHWTSATWALEAAGILWISLRQQRHYAQWFAMALQIAAGTLFLLRNADDFGNTAWLNPAFLGGVFIALGAFASARLLFKLDADHQLRPLHSFFFVWAMGWWLGSALLQIDHYLDYQISATLGLLTFSAVVLTYLDQRRGWYWAPAHISLAALLPLLLVLALLALDDYGHLLVWPDALFWLLALGLNYHVLVLLENTAWPSGLKTGMHVAWLVLVVCILSLDLYWYFDLAAPEAGSAYIALLTVFPLLGVYAARSARLPAIARLGPMLQYAAIAALAMLLALWSILVNISTSADPTPLPYVPFFNPVDLAHLVFFIALARVLRGGPLPWKAAAKPIYLGIAGLVFMWVSTVLLRSMHFYRGIPYDWDIMFASATVQTALSILWAIIGMLAMLVASRKLLRPVWIAGASLVLVVLVKMFFIDLDASGTVERIVSFLVVGSLLVAMGYFSPLPVAQPARDADPVPGS